MNMLKCQNVTQYFIALTLLCAGHAVAQTGSIYEPVRYIGGEIANPNLQDGALRYAIGTENRQTLRANRTHPEMADGFGWTYNHASNLAYWNGKFYQQYLSNPVDEHIKPGQTLLMVSANGRDWNKPEVIFPPYQAPPGVQFPKGYDGYMMHQRMGFYVAPDGRLLTVAFYGHTEDPFKEGGIGRVVREIYKNGTYGPIYFIRYSSHADWNESNTSYPFYKKSPDAGFVKACEALLSDKLKTRQWWDEDRGLDGFYGKTDTTHQERIEALSYFHRADGKVVGLYKFSYASLSADEGKIWSAPVKVPSLIMPGGKNWGQRTKDGRYAMSFNPIATQEYRYPLIITTSDDGVIFDHLLVVHGEVPPRRFFGRWKDFGPCYVRGIAEGNGIPDGNNMWLTYTVNKEDAWVSRIPLPVRYKVTGPVKDNFNHLKPGGDIIDWNIYAPKWAPVDIANFPSDANKSLILKDSDPYDYARAIRVFQEGTQATISFSIFARQTSGELEVDITDRHGSRPVRIGLDEKGKLVAFNGVEKVFLPGYEEGKWYTFKIVVRTENKGSYDLYLNNKLVLEKAMLSEAVKSVERISFRTGKYRNKPDRSTPNETPEPPLPGADEQVSESAFYIDDVVISSAK
ncbi:hypothetical protein DYBT9275_05740 [Dyadobacter sp. CECT 9275]|uniref:BNR repeat-like domain-containing protein n=1 Tax=Dyadobacter helix TaxID=2822344 RepID=A0A916JJN2_9BACT|nr:exo-alpha-sialidase [Dyadobacter sp. CECT 9275]CAG5017287.1 hypothetical protein DYBT9275_05740 [Dyadobacter sp. CECT 9275]